MRLIKNLLPFLLTIISFGNLSANENLRVEPPFWFTDMKNSRLQLMFYGNEISKKHISLKNYPGVKITSIDTVKNPNYLFVYLEIDSLAKPGELLFKIKGKDECEYKYRLLPRNTKTGAQGFSSEDVLYLIMPDRFANGNPDNDNLEDWIADRSNGWGHHGGDIKGIQDHLDYLDELGVTAIWLNPVQFNKGNASHGYAISDYYLIDPRLGTNEEYCTFIEEAHKKGIKVVMDMIFNHSGSSHWWLSDIPTDDWFNQNEHAVKAGQNQNESWRRFFQGNPTPEQIQMYLKMLRNQTDNWPSSIEEFEALPEEEKAKLLNKVVKDSNDLITNTHYKWVLMDPHAPQSEKDILLDGWFSGGMPDLNQRNPYLADYLIQNSIWWIEYSRIDGIRMDTYPYADYEFMKRWCEEIEAQYPDFNIVGEGWYPRNSAAGWWQKGSTVNPHDSKLKTVMDFDLTFTTQKEILKESNTKEGSEAGLFKMYEAVTQDFLIPDPNYVLTFLDNHDISRFMQPGDPDWKLKQGLAFLLTTRGIPQLYYGTEIGMEGPEMRDDFPGGWATDSINAFLKDGRTNRQNDFWDYTSKLLNWRRNSNPVKNGKLIHYTPDNISKCYVYARTDGKDTVLVVINGSDTMRILDTKRFKEVIDGFNKGRDVISEKEIDITSPVLIEPRGVYILDLE